MTWEFVSGIWGPRRNGVLTVNAWSRFVDVRGLGLCLVSNKQGRPTEIWQFDGEFWMQLHTATLTASGRNAPAVAWDDRRGVLVLHGGDVGGQPLADTWEWGRTTWRQRSSGGPLARSQHDMVFDAIRGEMMLFAGAAGTSTLFSDLWLWNGSYWAERFGLVGPAQRGQHHMFFDPRRGVSVLFGGLDATSSARTDVADWNGTAWMLHTPATRPPSTGPIAYDLLRGVAVALVESAGANATWELTVLPPVTGRWNAFGTACPTSVGLPRFGSVTPVPYVGETFQTEVTNVPSHLLVVAIGVLGASRTAWNGLPLPVDLGVIGMTGCSLLVGADVLLPLPRSGSTVTWSLPIPLDHDLVAAPFFQQLILSDPGINPLGLATTGGGDAVIGRR